LPVSGKLYAVLFDPSKEPAGNNFPVS
jgi:hypothetical protein